MADLKVLAAAERADLADLLDTLTPEQWEAPSLCEGWTVREVVAHVISYEELGLLGIPLTMARAGFRPGQMNDVRRAAYRDYTPAQLIEILRTHLRPSGLTAMFGGAIGLTDCVIHHQDIRRPLGLPREVPPERLVEVLGFSLRAPVLPSKANLAGLKAIATDVDWTHGSGPEITGPGEAILLALAGRADALTDLDGPGLAMLSERVGAQAGS